MTDNNLPALDALADKINTEHEACRASMQKGLEHALEAGRLLLEAKKGLPHGEWLPWLKESCPDISERTAQNYMRLAREVPKLEPGKAQRVADLSYRDAIRVVSQGIGGIASQKPADQAVMIEAMERGETFSGAARELKRQPSNVAIVPSNLRPNGEGRRIGILANREAQKISVVVGPNRAGADLCAHLEETQRGNLYTEWRGQIEALKVKTEQLRQEAEHLEAQARGQERDMQESLALDIEEEHGPALHYVETWDYELDDEAWATVNTKKQPEDVAAYLFENTEVSERGWWGDITLGPYSANGPGHDAPAAGWNGWGSSEWLGEFFPGGLAPKTAQA